MIFFVKIMALACNTSHRYTRRVFSQFSIKLEIQPAKSYHFYLESNSLNVHSEHDFLFRHSVVYDYLSFWLISLNIQSIKETFNRSTASKCIKYHTVSTLFYNNHKVCPQLNGLSLFIIMCVVRLNCGAPISASVVKMFIYILHG